MLGYPRISLDIAPESDPPAGRQKNQVPKQVQTEYQPSTNKVKTRPEETKGRFGGLGGWLVRACSQRRQSRETLQTEESLSVIGVGRSRKACKPRGVCL